MESPKAEMNFRRQPEAVTVTVTGDDQDVEVYVRLLLRAAESHGDLAQRLDIRTFRIYPRAVND